VTRSSGRPAFVATKAGRVILVLRPDDAHGDHRAVALDRPTRLLRRLLERRPVFPEEEQCRAYLVFSGHFGDVVFEVPGLTGIELRARIAGVSRWLERAASATAGVG
jgi:hypothetical protein